VPASRTVPTTGPDSTAATDSSQSDTDEFREQLGGDWSDEQIQDLKTLQEAGETGNSYLAAAAGDSIKDVMGTIGTTAFGVGVATGNVPLMAASLGGVATLGALKGVAGKGVENTVLNLKPNNNNLRAAAKDTWTNTRIGQIISDFRNRSAYSTQAGDAADVGSADGKDDIR